MLTVNGVEVIYSKVILVIKGISFEVPDRQIVCLLGANGAGKTTILKAISGLLKAELGVITDGHINWDNRRIDRMRPEEIVGLGVVQVLEGRRLFRHLTTEDNLKTGAHIRKDHAVKRDIDMVYELFPRLNDLKKRTSGYLSGGEQQMLVIGRALMAKPQLILLDEPSLGLAPMLADEILKKVKMIQTEEGTSFLLVEQNAKATLEIADYGYIMETGRIVFEGSAEQLINNEDIKEFYIGLSELGQRKSYREVKHYRRRKRW
ncbi:MAG: ABC transporter ATP-binding protein [Chloroflexi bacterium]|nr:ABC transporter ATP-binding protein [Chloroflexota bacterium]